MGTPSKKITVRISGGLGNQMFQYALARAIKEKTGLEVVLDIHFYTNIIGREAKRSFDLEAFNISLPRINRTDAGVFEKLTRSVCKIADSGKPLNRRKYIIEPSFTYQKEMNEQIRDNSYIAGIWQSEKYFLPIEHIIQSEFTLKNELSAAAQAIRTEIDRSEAVSIHVRRGDYVSNTHTNQKHGVCPPEYYVRAIKHIQAEVSNPHFFIFSDDIAWVRSQLTIPGSVTYVSNNSISSQEELMLMSYCRHNIIANSSFSWWGAWLNKYPEKVVIAPKKWFNLETIDTRDLIPESWIQI